MTADDPTRWTTDDVAAHLGYTSRYSRQSAARALHRWGIHPVGRQPGRSGQNLWDAQEVRDAKVNALGQGFRTDRTATRRTQ